MQISALFLWDNNKLVEFEELLASCVFVCEWWWSALEWLNFLQSRADGDLNLYSWQPLETDRGSIYINVEARTNGLQCVKQTKKKKTKITKSREATNLGAFMNKNEGNDGQACEGGAWGESRGNNKVLECWIAVLHVLLSVSGWAVPVKWKRADSCT